MAKAIAPNIYPLRGGCRLRMRLPCGVKVDRPYYGADAVARARKYRELVLGSESAALQRGSGAGRQAFTARGSAAGKGARWSSRDASDWRSPGPRPMREAA